MTRREEINALRDDGLTIREIQTRLGMSSPSLVQYYLERRDPLHELSKAKVIACVRRLQLVLPKTFAPEARRFIDSFIRDNLNR